MILEEYVCECSFLSHQEHWQHNTSPDTGGCSYSMHLWHQDLIIIMPYYMVYQIWYCTKVQKNQNAAARVVIGTNKFEHITPVLNNLHWLSVKFRINFKILLLTFKAYHGLAASYLCDLIDKNLSTYSLRNYDDFLLVEPRTKFKMYSDGFQ